VCLKVYRKNGRRRLSNAGSDRKTSSFSGNNPYVEMFVTRVHFKRLLRRTRVCEALMVAVEAEGGS